MGLTVVPVCSTRFLPPRLSTTSCRLVLAVWCLKFVCSAIRGTSVQMLSLCQCLCANARCNHQKAFESVRTPWLYVCPLSSHTTDLSIVQKSSPACAFQRDIFPCVVRCCACTTLQCRLQRDCLHLLFDLTPTGPLAPNCFACILSTCCDHPFIVQFVSHTRLVLDPISAPSSVVPIFVPNCVASSSSLSEPTSQFCADCRAIFCLHHLVWLFFQSSVPGSQRVCLCCKCSGFFR